jgi:bifunctional non-homologous end joining protein LigD
MRTTGTLPATMSGLSARLLRQAAASASKLKNSVASSIVSFLIARANRTVGRARYVPLPEHPAIAGVDPPREIFPHAPETVHRMPNAAFVAAGAGTRARGGRVVVSRPAVPAPMSRQSTLPKRLQPMLATLTDAPFDDAAWIFEDKYDGFRMVSEIRRGKVALYSRNGKIISDSYIEVAKALEGVKADAVIDGELVAIGKDGVSHFQLLQNALRHEAKLLYCAFDLMFFDGDDLRKLPLLERKKRLKAILPRHKLIAFSKHRKSSGKKFFAEAERKHLEGIMAKRADSPYASGSRTADWLKVKTAQRQEVVIAGFTAPRRTRPLFGALALAVREDGAWRYIGHVGTGFSRQTLEELHGKLVKLKTAKSPFPARVKDEAVTTWVRPSLVAEVKFAEWTSKGELRQPVYLGLRADKKAVDVARERARSRK